MVPQSDTSKTILVIVTGLLALSLFLKVPALAFVSVGIGGISILFPYMAKGVEWLWFKLAFVLGWINTRILLSVVYFIFLLPISLVSRLFVKDPLQLKRKTSASIYTSRTHTYKKTDLENIW
jgi:hypothetical protein